MESKEDKIKRLKKEIEQLENEKTIEVGVWYRHSAGGYWIWKDEDTYYGFDLNMRWIELQPKKIENYFLKSLLTPTIREEVESALLRESKRRGYKKGVKIRNVDDGEEHFPEIDGLFLSDDCLSLFDGWGSVVFEDGEWAEIIKEPEFKVGDIVVVIPEDEFYYNSDKNKACEIIGIGGNPLFKVKFRNGEQNSYSKIRKAYKEEIEEYRKPVLFTTEDGVDIREGMSYWCVNTAPHLLSLWEQTANKRTQLNKTVRAFCDYDKAKALQKSLIKLPTINGYEGKELKNTFQWGCFSINKDDVYDLIRLNIVSFTIMTDNQRAYVTEEYFNRIKEYINKSK